MKSIKSLFTLAFVLCFGLSYGQMTVNSVNNVGVGTSSPTEKLTVEGGKVGLNNPGENKNIVGGLGNARRLSLTSNVASSSESSSFFTMWGDETHDGPGATLARAGELAIQCKYFQVATNKPVPGFAQVAFEVDANGNVNNFMGTTSNSFRLITNENNKKEIASFNYGLEEILLLTPKQFTQEGIFAKNNANQVSISTQELVAVAPELVGSVQYNDYENDIHEEYQTIDMTAITFMLVNSIKDQQELINAKDAKIANLEARLIAIENKLANK